MNFIRNIGGWLPFLLFIAAAAAITALLKATGADWTIAITEAVSGSLLLIGAAWAGIRAVSSYPTKAGLILYALITGIAAGCVAWALQQTFLKWWFYEQPSYIAWLKETKPVRLAVAILAAGWIVSFTATQRKIAVLEDQFRNMRDAAALHREAELFKLRQQLQPHFLYNSLNSISALIMILPEKAQEMVGKLSDFLRNSVKREGREYIPVQEELDYIEAYLCIETVRFGDRLCFDYNKSFTDQATIPPFVLQPLLENAIKFGLYGQTGKVTITMNIVLKERMLTITISNPYDPANRPPSGTGFGLEGITRRLFLLYGRNDLLETSQHEGSFTTTIKIPQD